MRWIVTSLLVATLGCAAFGQGTPPPTEPSPELRIAPNATIELAPKLWDKKSSFPTIARLNRHDNDLCYTMHTYMFDRDGTDTPEMIGETTCTPARKFSVKRIMPKPARLLPAN